MGVERFDVAVIGGGPAGSATALAIAQKGCTTILLEASCYESQRIGETLPPETRRLLSSLGVWEKFLADAPAPCPGLQSVWGAAQIRENNFIANPYGLGWHVDRSKFDRMLLKAAEQGGVSTYLNTAPTLCTLDESGFWRIEFLGDHQQQRQIQATLLVDATGRKASLSRKNGAKRLAFDRLIGVVGFLLPVSGTPFQSGITLVEAAEKGWWYSAMLPDKRLVVAYMTDSDLISKDQFDTVQCWTKGIRRAANTRSRAEHFLLETAPQFFAANSSRLSHTTDKKWIAVGDAAMAFDPLSSQGVYRALEFGLLAASAVCEHLNGNRYSLHAYTAEVEKCFADYLIRLQAFYMMERRWRESAFWKRRFSDPVFH